jgi:plasmid stability protein
MSEVEPAVVRVIDVPAGILLPELHDVLQAAIGWTDSHLHQFVADEVRYGMPDIDDFNEFEDERPETGVPLRALPARFVYLYDFGDDWQHQVELSGPGGDRPGIIEGQGACPPEDVGGPHGYADFSKVLANPRDSEHEQIRGWAGAWKHAFDLATADLLVRQTVGEVPAPVRLVVDLTADGVKLTPGGRLPRAIVRKVQEHYPDWYPLGRPTSIEEDLPPLAALHDLLRDVGLLRLRKGILPPRRQRRHRGDPAPAIVVRTSTRLRNNAHHRRSRAPASIDSQETAYTETVLALLAEVFRLAAVSIRNLDNTVRERLRVRAAAHGRSMEAEMRAILVEAVRDPGDDEGLLDALLARFGELGGVDLDLPYRSVPPRAADFTT